MPGDEGPSSPLDAALTTYLAHLSVERGLSVNTLAAYRRDLTRYLEHVHRCGRRRADEVTAEDLSAFVSHLQTGEDGGRPLSPASSARSVAAVRGFHRFCAAEDGGADPALDLRAPSQARRLPKAITTAEVERLLDAASLGDGPLPLRDRALLELLYSTGARISEAVNLAVDDIDLELGAVRLLGKGSKERVVPVGSYARRALDAYLVRARPELAARGRGAASVFLNTRGAPLSRQSAWAVLRVAGERAGLPQQVSPHTLRHSFATHLLAGGADVRVVQELLGHASVTTTQIYTLVTPDTLREVYASAHPRARD